MVVDAWGRRLGDLVEAVEPQTQQSDIPPTDSRVPADPANHFRSSNAYMVLS